MNIENICNLVEECFELKQGSISPDSASGDIADWDSLGHFAILEFIYSKFPGVTDEYPGLAQAGSIQELYDLGLKNVN